MTPNLLLRYALFVVGCTCFATSAQAQIAAKPRIILLTPFVDYAFFQPMKQGAADAAAAIGVDVTFAGTPDGDVTALARQEVDALNAGYDGIGINMVDATAFDAVADAAAKKRVPLISFNVDDARTPNARLATVGQNMSAAGRAFGAAIAPAVPQAAHVLLTMHDPGITALEERAAGAKDALAGKELTWTTIITGTDKEQAVAKIKAALDNNPRIRVILGTGEADTQAGGLAVERYFKDKGYIAAGFDTGSEILRLVKAGIIRLTVDQQPYAQGYFAVTNLALARKGIHPVNVDTGAAIINAESVRR